MGNITSEGVAALLLVGLVVASLVYLVIELW